MKANKSSIIFLKDWTILIQSLPPDKQLVFWNLFVNYHFELECEDIIVKPIWNFVKSQLINMENKYNENIVERNKINGSKGGRPKTQINPENPMGLNETQKTLNDNVNENVNENNNDNILLEKEPKGNFSFIQELKKIEADEKLIFDWLKVRKNKKATNTETSFKNFISQVEKSNMTINEVLKICIEKDWKGFNHEWIQKEKVAPKEKIDIDKIDYSNIKGWTA